MEKMNYREPSLDEIKEFIEAGRRAVKLKRETKQEGSEVTNKKEGE